MEKSFKEREKFQELTRKEEDLKEVKGLLKLKEKERDSFELDNDDYVNSYDNMLDEAYGDFMNMSASRILKECDPIAYRCGLSDYVDSIDKEDNSDYKEILESIEGLENQIYDLESEIKDLEAE